MTLLRGILRIIRAILRILVGGHGTNDPPTTGGGGDLKRNVAKRWIIDNFLLRVGEGGSDSE